MVLGILVFSFCLRVFERPVREETGQDFSSYSTSIWCLVITMTTVGYGDFYPVTELGRLTGFVACIYGVMVVSLMVVSLSNNLILDTGEERTYIVLQRLQFKLELRKIAACVISSGVSLILFSKKPQRDPRVSMGQFRKYANQLRTLKIKNRTLYNFDTYEDRIETKLLDIVEEFAEIEQKHRTINSLLNDLCNYK